MKALTYLFSFAAAALMLVGCNKEQINPEQTADKDLVTYSFTASIDDPEVRSTLTNAGVFSWVAGDHIAIYNSTTSAYVDFSVTAVDDSGNATITADAASGAVWTNAIYPYDRAAGAGNEVDYTVTTVSGPILVSQVSGQTLSFKYLGAVVNVQVTGAPSTSSTLTFTANSSEFGSLSFSWSGDSPILEGTGSQASITVPFNASGITSIPVPQASYAGFTITVDNEAGRHLYKKTTSNTFDLSSKKLLPMPELTYAAPSEFYVTTSSDSKYWDKSNVRMIQTGANDYEVWMNCDGNTTIKIFDEYNKDNLEKGVLNTGSVTDGNFYKITWNSSNESGGPEYVGATANYPFYNTEFPSSTFAIAGLNDDWSTLYTMTYNGNMSWEYEGITVTKGTHEFKLRNADADSYWAGESSGLGDALYGKLLSDSSNNASITLDAGTYNVYVNATQNWYYSIMFVKQ